MPLIVAIVQRVMSLPGLATLLDPETGRPKPLKKQWGFRCELHPLRYKREESRRQQTLNVAMRVKSPLHVHVDRLRGIIRHGAPRIERALRESRHVHFAWFEFIDNDSTLVLHTIYDGDFDAYIQHFALKVNEVFDLLFQHIEDAPPTPVAQYPDRFIDRIRSYNRTPVGGYLFSAYPALEVSDIVRPTQGLAE
jgi:hypothetical protein